MRSSCQDSWEHRDIGVAAVRTGGRTGTLFLAAVRTGKLDEQLTRYEE